jgi:hypothetical protein
MSVTSFLNPDNEQVDNIEDLDGRGVLVDLIAKSYTQKDAIADPDEVINEVPKVRMTEVLASLNTVHLYEEQQQYGSKGLVRGS